MRPTRLAFSDMITPSPTTKIDPRLARGVLQSHEAATATRPARVVISIPNTSYELHLIPSGTIKAEIGKRIVGTIRARARRIDRVESGGRYVEPVFGRPRRVQGTVLAIEGASVVVHAGVPIHCEPTDPRQQASQFQPGELVSFDVLDGATFTQSA